MTSIPLTREEANEYIDRLHRHHTHTVGDKFRVGCEHNGQLVGVIQVGRPVSRNLDNGRILEVTRLCTDGTKNACSYLYATAARVAKEMGYDKIITYILCSESGASLRAAGWQKEADIKGHNWSCKSRPRSTTAPICNKQRWSKILKGDKLI